MYEFFLLTSPAQLCVGGLGWLAALLGSWIFFSHKRSTTNTKFNSILSHAALNKQCTLVVCLAKDKAKYAQELAQAASWKIPVVTEDYLVQCEKQLRVLAKGPFLLDKEQDEMEEEKQDEQDKGKGMMSIFAQQTELLT